MASRVSERLQAEITQEYQDILDGVAKASVNATLYGWSLVTAKNPVLTGRSRAAWNIASGSPDDSVPPKVERPADGRYPTPPPPARPQGIRFDPIGDENLILSNNTEYITYLEEGTDKIEAFGMVEKSIGAIENKLQMELDRL